MERSRLDKAVSQKIQQKYPELSRSRIQALIAAGHLKKTNGSNIKDAKQKVTNGEEYILHIPKAEPLNLQAENIPLNIIFEDEDLLVINKQAGLPAHPGPGETSGSLVNALLAYCPDSLSGIGGKIRPGIVHRLDKYTSGLMLVAKNDHAHQNLAKQLEKRTVSRLYTALCFGLAKPLSGTIVENICRDEKKRHLMRTAHNKGRLAITHYTTQEILLNGLFSLIECKLETGRTHQIRVHLNHIKHSLVGDQEYGQNKQKIQQFTDEKLRAELTKLNRQFLHAKEISFIHPRSKKEMSFACEIAAELQELLNFLRNYQHNSSL